MGKSRGKLCIKLEHFFRLLQEVGSETKVARESLVIKKECTGADTVVLVPVGLQRTPQSMEPDY